MTLSIFSAYFQARPSRLTSQPGLAYVIMEKKDLYDEDTFEAVSARLENLTPDTRAEWGAMDVSQMLAHCAEILEVTNGKALKGTPVFVRLIGGFIRKMVLSEKPYPRDSRTHPQYIKTEPEDFYEQKERLQRALGTMLANGPISSRHPLFGIMTGEEKGWAMFKHLDHHFSQFGV